jgi:hypothetical protein
MPEFRIRQSLFVVIFSIHFRIPCSLLPVKTKYNSNVTAYMQGKLVAKAKENIYIA